MDKNFVLKGFGSAAIHAGHEQDPQYAHLTPIYASSTYVYDTAEQGMKRFSGEEEGYIYARWGNPTISEAKEQREKYGITDGLIRMNVGIENLQDIFADLDQAVS